MNILAKILSHGFAVAVVALLAVGFIYRGELFPELQLPDFLLPESETVADSGETGVTVTEADAGQTAGAPATGEQAAADVEAPTAESDTETAARGEVATATVADQAREEVETASATGAMEIPAPTPDAQPVDIMEDDTEADSAMAESPALSPAADGQPMAVVEDEAEVDSATAESPAAVEEAAGIGQVAVPLVVESPAPDVEAGPEAIVEEAADLTGQVIRPAGSDRAVSAVADSDTGSIAVTQVDETTAQDETGIADVVPAPAPVAEPAIEQAAPARTVARAVAPDTGMLESPPVGVGQAGGTAASEAGMPAVAVTQEEVTAEAIPAPAEERAAGTEVAVVEAPTTAVAESPMIVKADSVSKERVGAEAVPAPVLEPPAGTGDAAIEVPAPAVPEVPALGKANSYQLLASAREAYWLHDYPRAESIYLELTELEPENPDWYGELGNMYFSQGKWEKSASAYYEAGTRLVKAGRFDRARELVKVIRGLDGSQAQALEKMISDAGASTNQ